MSTLAIIAIVAAAIVLAVFLGVALRRVSASRAATKERRAREVADHRAQAEAHTEKARELGGELEHHRAQAERQRAEADRHRAEAIRQEELAEEHEEAASEAAERAQEIEERIPREGRGADLHDQRAAELEKKL